MVQVHVCAYVAKWYSVSNRHNQLDLIELNGSLKVGRESEGGGLYSMSPNHKILIIFESNPTRLIQLSL